MAVQVRSSGTAAARQLFDCSLFTPAFAGLFVTSLKGNLVLALIQMYRVAHESVSVLVFTVTCPISFPFQDQITLYWTLVWHVLPTPLLLCANLLQF